MRSFKIGDCCCCCCCGCCRLIFRLEMAVEEHSAVKRHTDRQADKAAKQQGKKTKTGGNNQNPLLLSTPKPLLFSASKKARVLEKTLLFYPCFFQAQNPCFFLAKKTRVSKMGKLFSNENLVFLVFSWFLSEVSLLFIRKRRCFWQ